MHPLPALVHPLVGRRRELAEVRALVGVSRVTTVVGAAGVGKSHLAVELVGSLRRAFGGRIGYADLAAARNSEDVHEFIAAAVGLEDAPLDGLIEHLSSWDGLLLLEHCEHLLTPIAELVAALTRGGPHVRILSTSRTPLNIAGESLFSLGPLDAPDPHATEASVYSDSDSVQLFRDRAVRVAPTLDTTSPAASVAIAEICYRLDGLPLAIELAAARTRVLQPVGILERLREPFRLLIGGGRNTSERNRTLHASIKWSFDLCTPGERELWSLLSVFVDGFTLAAAEHVAGERGLDQHDVLDLVHALIDRSLLSVAHEEDGERYFMLSPIRDFGQEVAADLLPRARSAHAAWYASFMARAAAEWYGPEHERWDARCVRELPNVRAALAFTIEEAQDPRKALGLLTPVWRGLWAPHGHLRELLDWLRAVAEIVDRGSALWIDVSTLRLHITSLLDGPSTARPGFLALREQAVRAGGGPALAAIDISLADEATPAQDIIDLFALVLADERVRAQPLALGRIQIRLALLFHASGRQAEADELIAKILARSLVGGERVDRAYLLLGLALNDLNALDEASAHRRVVEVLTYRTEGRPFPLLSQALDAAAVIALRGGNASAVASLTGFAAELRARFTSTASPFPALTALTQEAVRAARRVLGDASYDRHHAKGHALTYPGAVAIVLGGRTPPAGDVVPSHTDASVSLPRHPGLTRRQREVALLMADGLSDREIAERLVISRRTAEGHVQAVLVALGVSSRTQVVAQIAAGRIVI